MTVQGWGFWGLISNDPIEEGDDPSTDADCNSVMSKNNAPSLAGILKAPHTTLWEKRVQTCMLGSHRGFISVCSEGHGVVGLGQIPMMTGRG